MVWITKSLSFINWTKQFKMQGPNRSIRRRMIKGPIKKDNKVVNQGDLLAQRLPFFKNNRSRPFLLWSTTSERFAQTIAT